MKRDIEKVKDTIRKLLAVTKESSGAYEGEINNALTAAQNLMAAYHLQEEDILKYEEEKQEQNWSPDDFVRIAAWSYKKQICSWESHLTVFCTEFFQKSVNAYINSEIKEKRDLETDILLRSSTGKIQYGQAIIFYGIREEVEQCIELFKNLQITITAMAYMKYGSVVRAKGREYGEGFVYGLSTKLSDTNQKLLSQDSQTNALIVRSNEVALAKAKASRKWLTKTHKIRISGTKKHTSSYNDYNAFQAGKKDGQETDLSSSSSPRKKRLN